MTRRATKFENPRLKVRKLQKLGFLGSKTYFSFKGNLLIIGLSKSILTENMKIRVESQKTKNKTKQKTTTTTTTTTKQNKTILQFSGK